MEEVRRHEVLKLSIEDPYTRDRSKIIADNAMKQIVKYTAQYSISDDQLEERLDEMVDTCGKQLPTPSHPFLLLLTECPDVLLVTKPSRIPSGKQQKTTARADYPNVHGTSSLLMSPTCQRLIIPACPPFLLLAIFVMSAHVLALHPSSN